MVSDLESNLTWQFNVNQFSKDTSGTTANNRLLLLKIKNSFLSFGSSPWTVVGSSNSVAAGLDAVDRWAAASNIVFNSAGNAHSWIVLKQTGLGSNFQILLDCNNTDTASLTVLMSMSAGFSGGSITAAPTAADSITVRSQSAYGAPGTGGGNVFASIVHAMQSTDGYGTTIIITRAGGPDGVGSPIGTEPSGVCGVWHFGFAKNPLPTWSNPIIGWVRGDSSTSGLTPGSGIASFGTYTLSSTIVSMHNSTAISMRATCEGFGTSLLLEALPIPNEIDGKRPFYPIGMYSLTSGLRGRTGEVQDIYFAPLEYGHLSCYEDIDGNTRKFIQFENMVFPWDGGYVLTY